MDVLDAVGVEVDDLVGRVGDTRLLHGRGVMPELIHQRGKAAGHEGSRQLERALHLIRTRDGHDTGDHGHRNARLADLIEEIIVQIVIKKHLGGQEIATRIHLFLEVSDVLPLVGAFGMHLGVARAADAEIGIRLPQLADKLHRMAIIPTRAVSPLQIGRNIAAQSHDVLDTRRTDIGNSRPHRLAGGRDTSQVRKGGHTVLTLDILCNIQSITAGASARTVSHADVSGMQVGNRLGSRLHALKSGVGLGREDLKGHGQLPFCQQFGDFHDVASVSWFFSFIISRGQAIIKSICLFSRVFSAFLPHLVEFYHHSRAPVRILL